jgi:hypothetical protein
VAKEPTYEEINAEALYAKPELGELGALDGLCWVLEMQQARRRLMQQRDPGSPAMSDSTAERELSPKYILVPKWVHEMFLATLDPWREILRNARKQLNGIGC